MSREIANRLTRVFLRDKSGRRPVYGGTEKFQTDPYWKDYVLLSDSAPEMLILDSQMDLPEEPAIHNQLGKAELLCGHHPTFIPTSVSGELREASEMYLRSLVCHCDPTPAAQSARPCTR